MFSCPLEGNPVGNSEASTPLQISDDNGTKSPRITVGYGLRSKPFLYCQHDLSL
jgi:hypothetical protein